MLGKMASSKSVATSLVSSIFTHVFLQVDPTATMSMYIFHIFLLTQRHLNAEIVGALPCTAPSYLGGNDLVDFAIRPDKPGGTCRLSDATDSTGRRTKFRQDGSCKLWKRYIHIL